MPPPQTVISHAPLNRQQPVQVNPQGHVNLTVNNKPTLIGGALGEKKDVHLHVNVQESRAQMNRPGI